jgi:GNAT superfamily N-acetyltransferase
MTTLTIRPANAADTPGLFEVRTSVVENALSRDELAALGITEISIADMIAQAPCAWGANEDGRIVGFSIVNLDDGALFATFVLPTNEGRGIGRRLVQPAGKALFEQHAVAWLETGEANRAAGFYRRLGWGNEHDIGGGDVRMEKLRRESDRQGTSTPAEIMSGYVYALQNRRGTLGLPSASRWCNVAQPEASTCTMTVAAKQQHRLAEEGTCASATFPTNIYAELERISEEKKMSVAWVVRNAVEKYIEARYPLVRSQPERVR